MKGNGEYWRYFFKLFENTFKIALTNTTINNELNKSECYIGQLWEGHTSDERTNPNSIIIFMNYQNVVLVFNLSNVQNWVGNFGVKYLSNNTFNIFST